MQKLITVNLDSRLFQLDERAYDALRAYIEHAESQLGANPDRVEIVRDLEQSIAEKLMKPGEPPRTIVTVADVDDVLRQIGPVDAGAPGWGSALPSGAPRSGSAPRRLYRVHEGAMIAGLCNGIAAHFNTDPTLVRIAFAAAGIVEIAAFDRPPAGVAGLYAILVFIVPYAASAPEGAQAMPGSLMDKVRVKVERVRRAVFGGVRHNARSG